MLNDLLRQYLEETVEGIPRPVYGVLDEVGMVLEGAQGNGAVVGIDAAAVRLCLEG